MSSSMDVDMEGAVALAPQGTAGTGATVLCWRCGAPIDGMVSADSLCGTCIRIMHDISKSVEREPHIQFCKDCNRWMLPPTSWVVAAPESREMLAFCLKRTRGLGKVRVVDASFIWTEPNSRRIRVKLTIQDSVADGVLLQQTFEIMYVVGTHQCPECAKSYTANVWRATVQVRQKVLHKRTFLYLEQLILKHGAHKDTINIKEAKDGIDFFFAHKNQAVKFVDFLKGVVPVNVKTAPELISEDIRNNTKSMKFAFSVEILPICKDDLVALPIPLAKKIGNISPLCLCYKIGTAVYLIDPSTLQTAEITGPVYWREKQPFTALAETKDLVEFIVMQVDDLGAEKGKWQKAGVTVARAADFGSEGNEFYCRTHLGRFLQEGDSVMGYMLTGSNYNSHELDEIEASHAYGSTIPDVILVKKHWPRRRKHRRRNWKLKRMAKEEGELLPKKADQDRMEAEYEQFLQDVEEDTELQAVFDLYKAKKRQQRKEAQAQAQAMEVDGASVAGTEQQTDAEEGEDDEDDDEDAPRVNMDELLDDLQELDINDGAQ